jgi:hypothetical protein
MKVLKKGPNTRLEQKMKNHQIFNIKKVGGGKENQKKKTPNPKPLSVPERKVCASSQGTPVTIL